MVNWTPNPECKYTYQYDNIFAFIAEKKDKAKTPQEVAEAQAYEYGCYRTLILNDLFFIVQFVMEVPPQIDDTPFCNHPFVVNACREIQGGPSSGTLDIFAREHFKTTIISIAETIQYALRHPDSAQAIFSYIRPRAKDILFSIKETFEQKELLRRAFPDIVWENPSSQAPKWSLDEGIVLKRNSTRKESTISAWGLTEGMPTGGHFERRVYDDIVTEDIAESGDIMEKVKLKFDSSQNLGTITGIHRVTGTYYAYGDPLMYIRDKEDLITKEKVYTLRLKPATDNGKINGNPVFLPIKRHEELKQTKTYNCQQLLDPVPEESRTLEGKMLHPIEPQLIPRDVFRFMVVDAAGDDKNGKGDSWAFGVFGVRPYGDEMGLYERYILDLEVEPMREEEAPERIARMYMRNGLIMQTGVEKVALSTTEIHVAAALAKYHRYVSVNSKTLVILSPAGREKKKKIERALAAPLYNGKWFYSTHIPNKFIERIKMELDMHPKWHDDGIEIMAYLDDMIKDYRFGWNDEDEYYEPKKVVSFSGRSRVTGY